ncbi:glycerophosphodiester phosphodiesterase [Clostridium aestuarii]|uniref:Glycerophosphodiester phosphodiesterase n=1 Tax=Clostridium aestuarii TaxID=338193 RepID=A0ABT4CVQ3_9CLOT|nr:glycerophosphodiester phosphodiesterase [Clostridium aestuarii]MCY6483046.1 glycerophosphodiester phosphodiesterase [Clostridium aestuarii]
MKNLWGEYKQILHDFKFGFSRFIKYQICTKLLIGIILLPFLKIILNLLMKSRGLSYITNGLLTRFLLSPQGIISIVLLAVFGVLVTLIEIGGLIVLSHQVITKSRESSYYTIFKYCMRRIKHFIGIDGLIIVLCLVIIFPWLHLGIYTSLISDVKIPGFIKDVIDQNMIFFIMLKILTLVFVILSIRWIFTMHVIMLKNKKAKKALKESSRLVKNNLKTFIKKTVGILLVSALVLGGLAALYLLVIFLIIRFIGGINVHWDYIILMISGVGVLFGSIGSFIVVPFQILYLTRLFYHLNNDEILDIALDEKKNNNSLVDKIFNSKKIGITLFVGIVLFTSIFTIAVMEYMEGIKYNVKITAHRGSSKDAPENTLEAIDVAIKNKADYAEIDVQETKDNKVVLIHDKSLSRTAGLDKNIWEANLDEIKQLDAGSWFDERFKGVRIPTLEEVIDHSRGKIKLNIEIKTNGHEKKLVQKVVNLIKRKGIINSCVVTSLNYNVIQEVEAMEPRIKTGYIMYVAIGNLHKLNVDFYSVEETNVTEKFVADAHMIGREVHVWTINEEEDMQKVIDLGVDNIITDNYKILLQKLSNHRK